MDHTDTQMMETETTTAPEITSNNNTGENDVITRLLTLARQFVNEGKPSQALQAVLMAMRTKGGDEAVFQSLHRARELYRTRIQENTTVDRLASLFAECAIAEAQPLKAERAQSNNGSLEHVPDAYGTSILAETGRTQIVLDASSDGSSFICLKCGGLVSNHRKDEHYAYWCCQI